MRNVNAQMETFDVRPNSSEVDCLLVERSQEEEEEEKDGGLTRLLSVPVKVGSAE